MPNSTQRTVVTARQISTTCGELAAMLAKVDYLLEHNSDLSIDWAAGTTPDYIPEDVDGNIDGVVFSRSDVANAIGSLDQFRNLMKNQAVTQGDHLGNINKLASAMPLR